MRLPCLFKNCLEQTGAFISRCDRNILQATLAALGVKWYSDALNGAVKCLQGSVQPGGHSAYECDGGCCATQQSEIFICTLNDLRIVGKQSGWPAVPSHPRRAVLL